MEKAVSLPENPKDIGNRAAESGHGNEPGSRSGEKRRDAWAEYWF